MKVLCVCGSAAKDSSNRLLIESIKTAFQEEYQFDSIENIREFPLFRPEDVSGEISKSVLEFKSKLVKSDAVLISTPEYSHNIPAVLKNALEWITSSGELDQKPVLAITFTPHEPRGKWAMESLLFTLKALNAQIVTQLPLYKTDVDIKNNTLTLNPTVKTLVKEALSLL